MARPVFVVGMHRSGTSMVAGILAHLGIPMGHNLTAADWSNPYGHYEDKQFTAINRDGLRAAGGDWRHPPLPWAISGAGMASRAREYIARREEDIGKDAYWGAKDPRMALTLHVWLPLLGGARWIIVRRPLNEICASLAKRNQMPESEAIELWAHYIAAISLGLIDESEADVCVAHYKEITGEPRQGVERLAEWLGVPCTEEAIQHVRRKQ